MFLQDHIGNVIAQQLQTAPYSAIQTFPRKIQAQPGQDLRIDLFSQFYGLSGFACRAASSFSRSGSDNGIADVTVASRIPCASLYCCR